RMECYVEGEQGLVKIKIISYNNCFSSLRSLSNNFLIIIKKLLARPLMARNFNPKVHGNMNYPFHFFFLILQG
ncbi:hypothetical protein OB985_29575, partial [Bacillus cereus]|nr:hypothetical protein [Bacillus cereus]